MISLSIVVPAYNEEETIIDVLTRIQAQDVPGVKLETIVIDDGSTDGTAALLEAHPDLYSTFVKMPKNGGKGAAVRAGLMAAEGDFVLFQDADLEYDPDEYAGLLRPVRDLDADIVMGSRFIAPPITRVVYFWNKLGNRCITFGFNLLNNTTFSDVYSCYLLYRRSLVDPAQLKTDGWEQHGEILSLAVKKASRIYEVPISYHGRTIEEGKKIRAHHIFAVVWTMIVCRLFR